MDHFNYQNQCLFAENVNVNDIIAEVGSPCYIYSRATLERHWKAFDTALGEHPHMICFAVKANSNLAVLNLFARLGSGFDIVSGGELLRVIAAGGDASRVVFSGVGKSRHEIELALTHNIHCFNVESEAELDLINAIAIEKGVKASIALRVNPDVDAKTHPYISTGLKENKFGVDVDDAKRIYLKANEMPGISITGIACHIGSQLTEIDPFLDALDRVLVLYDELQNNDVHIGHLDLGGGLGISYSNEQPPLPADYARAILQRLGDRNIPLHFEPGRAIAGNAGILVTTVELLKHTEQKNFAVVDAAMNDLLRPALYSAWQEIIPVNQKTEQTSEVYDIVGPVCETGDFLGKERKLNLVPGDLLAVRSAGAYGFVMSSNYNTRPRVAEVMVDDDKFFVVRQRESFEDLVRGESTLP